MLSAIQQDKIAVPVPVAALQRHKGGAVVGFNGGGRVENDIRQ